jgi:nitroreductase
MGLFDLMKKRRSIRKYTGEKVSAEALNLILKAGLTSPSSRGFRPWEFITVRDKEVLDKLAQTKASGSMMLKNADCAVIVLADMDKSDVWVEDASIAMTYMHLMAAELGIGSCWIQCRLRKTADGSSSEEYVRDLLDIPGNYGVLAILSLGMPDEVKDPVSEVDLDMTKIHEEKF